MLMKNVKGKTKLEMPKTHCAARGFSLIELLVAVTVVLTAISGYLAVAAHGILALRVAREDVTAYFLAQEGLERVRAIRDNNRLQTPGIPWDSAFAPCLTPPATQRCTIGPIDSQPTNDLLITACPPVGCPVLRQSDLSGIYNYVTTNPTTPYVREIWLERAAATPPPGPSMDQNEILAKSRITWQGGASQKSLTLQMEIYDW